MSKAKEPTFQDDLKRVVASQSILVCQKELDEQHQRLQDIQYTLGYLREVTLELSSSDHDERFVTSVLALASEAAERACDGMVEDAIAYSSKMNLLASQAEADARINKGAKS